MDGNLPVVFGGIIGVLVTGIFTYATQRAAAKAAVRNAELTSRTDIEKEAFSRAEEYYKGVIDDQNKRIDAKEARNAILEAKVDQLEARVDTLEEELRVAKSALRLAFPDE